ncbi:MAG: hypothetical protein J5J06_06065 [Phycisphaerae bacterium]|nr:hypothetical protein [Phycisphaerae bacterium]
MYGKRISFGGLVVVLGAGLLAGCGQKAITGVQMTEQKMDQNIAAKKIYLAVMAENAMRQDMTVSDLHFVPHTAELNGTGVNRLDRMAQSLNTYGGTLHYDTVESDDVLVNARLDNIREYLALTGVNMDNVDVMTGISQGRTMPATEAMRIMEAGTAKQGGQQQQQQQGMGMMPSPTP